MTLPSITDSFVCRRGCPVCGGCGHVCGDHPYRPWGPAYGPDGCDCGAPGEPCIGTPIRYGRVATIRG